MGGGGGRRVRVYRTPDPGKRRDRVGVGIGLVRYFLDFNLFTAMIVTCKRQLKVQHYLKPVTVSVLFFALLHERIFIETHSTESRCYRSEKYTVWRRVRASFGPETLPAGTVKGLTTCQPHSHLMTRGVGWDRLRVDG